jgi:large subunit ribosomal protein L24
MSKIRKGDKVVVITGSDKGKKGEVVKLFPKEDRALVRGVNVVKRHQRQTQTRVGYKTLNDGKRVRVAKKSGEVIDV